MGEFPREYREVAEVTEIRGKGGRFRGLLRGLLFGGNGEKVQVGVGDRLLNRGNRGGLFGVEKHILHVGGKLHLVMRCIVEVLRNLVAC